MNKIKQTAGVIVSTALITAAVALPSAAAVPMDDAKAAVEKLGGSNIDDGEDGWHDYPNVLNKGEKHLPTTISFYQGPEYKKKWNKCRLQIRQAESRHVYGALNASRKYKGAYQMSPEFSDGAGWRIQKSMREQGAPKEQAFKIGEELRKYPAHRWHPFYQDWGFWTIFDNGKGASHWPNTRGSAC